MLAKELGLLGARVVFHTPFHPKIVGRVPEGDETYQKPAGRPLQAALRYHTPGDSVHPHRDYSSMVELMLAANDDYGGNILLYTDEFGCTPIHAAVETLDIDVLELFFPGDKKVGQKPCDLNRQDHDGNTALHYAAMMGWDGAADLLLHYHASPVVRNNAGQFAGNLTVADTRMSAILPRNTFSTGT
ncbi:hypothetical protein T484DRAFT_1753473 [Baffinella frigidus]|nr:hypothetical protein T484DRAFT_1753473 [Cryptophyta sp. CCMP2293]